MNPVVHFEIHAEDPQRAMAFYGAVFGWKFEDYSQYTGSPYWGVIAKEQDGDPGINGGLLQRNASPAREGASPNAFVCTLAVTDYDKTAEAILRHGGREALAKHALPGMAWQGYFIDPEGNLIGIHQPDTNAR